MTAKEDHVCLRRALLFMPGDSLRKITKATSLGVDSIVMDLEDGVALSQKEAARGTVVEALHQVDFGASERLVRINPAGGQLAGVDLSSTIGGRPDGYVIPKVASAGEVRQVASFLSREEHARGWPVGRIKLLPIIESALGIMNLQEIVTADPRVDVLLFGAEDLAGDMGAVRTKAGWEIFHARSVVVLAAKAHGLQAVDMVCFDLEDMVAFEEECRFGRQLGYDGKMVIHPRQVEIAQQVFAPAPEEIAHARRIVEAYAAHQAAGTGAFALDGRMVDMPVVRAAQKVLARAAAAGLLGA